MDAGFKLAATVPVHSPMPVSWLGLSVMPPQPPSWALVPQLTATQLQNLQAQIAYDQSRWDYRKIGAQNQLGRYQFATSLLETYGLLAPGANAARGTACVNFVNSWRPTYANNGVNVYQNYFYDISSLTSFLNTPIAQEHLAYQHIFDLYNQCVNAKIILSTDTADSVAGLIYVAWVLGVGNSASNTGAWAWRYNGNGAGTNSYNSGRYSVVVLSR